MKTPSKLNPGDATGETADGPANHEGEIPAKESIYWFNPLTGVLEKYPDFSKVNPARLVQVIHLRRGVLPDAPFSRPVLRRFEEFRHGLWLVFQILLGRAHFATYGKALKPYIKAHHERAAIQRALALHGKKRQ